MGMDGNELVSLLGHASIGSPLDDFLMRHGIKVRPKGNSGSYLLSDGLNGLDFEYKESQDFDDMSLMAAPSRGKFNLLSVEFNSVGNKKRQPFSGTLPFGLDFSMTPVEVAGLLGQPKDLREASESQGTIAMYGVGGCWVTVAHVVGDGGISWMRVGVPTVYHRILGYFD